MRKVKIAMTAMLAGAVIFCGGCGDSSEQKPPAQSAKQTQQSGKPKTESKAEVGEPVDTSIEVTKYEMDRFIEVAQYYSLTEDEVRHLVQVFKQVGVKFDLGIPVSVDRSAIDCLYPGTKPYLLVDGVPRNDLGSYIMAPDKNNSKEHDFDIVFRFSGGRDRVPIYTNGRIINTVKSLSRSVTDEVFRKMNDEISHANYPEGKFLVFGIHYDKFITRELTPEDYEYIRNNGGQEPEDAVVKDVTFLGVDALKSAARLAYIEGKPYISVEYGVLIESNVYGEGKKELHRKPIFNLDGTFSDFSLNGMTPEYNAGGNFRRFNSDGTPKKT